MIFHDLKNMLGKCVNIRPEHEPGISPKQLQNIKRGEPLDPALIDKDQSRMVRAIQHFKNKTYKCCCFTICKNVNEPMDECYIYMIIKDRKDLDKFFEECRDVRIKEVAVYQNLYVLPYGGRFLFSVHGPASYHGDCPNFCIANSTAEAYWACSKVIPESKLYSISVNYGLDLSGDFPEICLYNTLPQFGM